MGPTAWRLGVGRAATSPEAGSGFSTPRDDHHWTTAARARLYRGPLKIDNCDRKQACVGMEAWVGIAGRLGRKMTEGSDSTRLHQPLGSTCPARVDMSSSSRRPRCSARGGRDLSNERRTETGSAGRRRGAVTLVSSTRCAMWLMTGNFLEMGAVAAACHCMPAAPMTKATPSRLFGGTRLMTVECYARDRKIRDGVGGTELG